MSEQAEPIVTPAPSWCIGYVSADGIAIPFMARCTEHGDTACYMQADGSHMPANACTCNYTRRGLCPIDWHHEE